MRRVDAFKYMVMTQMAENAVNFAAQTNFIVYETFHLYYLCYDALSH